ncbi:MAG TPA: chromate transporter [Turneriella sp.]|nr:chromate transporter [Turneriella sp.]
MTSFLQSLLDSLLISVQSFGGIHSYWALIERQFVTGCTEHIYPELTEICRPMFKASLALAEVIPGPQVNAAAWLFYHSSGVTAVFGILLGALLPGITLAPLLVTLLRHARLQNLLREFIAGASVAAIALLLVFLLRLIPHTTAFYQQVTFGLIGAACFVVRHYTKANVLVIMLAAGVAGWLFL